METTQPHQVVGYKKLKRREEEEEEEAETVAGKEKKERDKAQHDTFRRERVCLCR